MQPHLVARSWMCKHCRRTSPSSCYFFPSRIFRWSSRFLAHRERVQLILLDGDNVDVVDILSDSALCPVFATAIGASTGVADAGSGGEWGGWKCNECGDSKRTPVVCDRTETCSCPEVVGQSTCISLAPPLRRFHLLHVHGPGFSFRIFAIAFGFSSRGEGSWDGDEDLDLRADVELRALINDQRALELEARELLQEIRELCQVNRDYYDFRRFEDDTDFPHFPRPREDVCFEDVPDPWFLRARNFIPSEISSSLIT